MRGHFVGQNNPRVWLGSAVETSSSGVWSAATASSTPASSRHSEQKSSWNADLVREWTAAKSLQAFTRRKVQCMTSVKRFLREIRSLEEQRAKGVGATSAYGDIYEHRAELLKAIHSRETVLINSPFGSELVGSEVHARHHASTTICRFAKAHAAKRTALLATLTVTDLVGPDGQVQSLGPIFSAAGIKSNKLGILYSNQFEAESPPVNAKLDSVAWGYSRDPEICKPECNARSFDVLSAASGCTTEPHGAAWEELFCAIVGDSFVAELKLYLGVEVAAPNSKDPRSNTSLHFAAWQGNLEACRWLVSQGADVHACNTDGRTPLHLAMLRNNDECVAFMTEAMTSPRRHLELGSSIISSLLAPERISRQSSDLSITIHSDEAGTRQSRVSEGGESLCNDGFCGMHIPAVAACDRELPMVSGKTWASALADLSIGSAARDLTGPEAGPPREGELFSTADSRNDLTHKDLHAAFDDAKIQQSRDFSNAMQAFAQAMRQGSACDTDVSSTRTSSNASSSCVDGWAKETPWSPSQSWADSRSGYEGVYTRLPIAQLSFLSPHMPATPDEFGSGFTPTPMSPLDQELVRRNLLRSPYSSPIPSFPRSPAVSSQKDPLLQPQIPMMEGVPEQDEQIRASPGKLTLEVITHRSESATASVDLSPGTLVRRRLHQARIQNQESGDSLQASAREELRGVHDILSQDSVDGFITYANQAEGSYAVV